MHNPPLGMPFLLENGDIESAAALCAELGLDFVELNMTFPCCNTEHLSAAMLRKLMKKYGIFFTLHLDEDLSPCTISAPVRYAWLSEICSALALAKEAHIPTVNMHWPRGVHVTLPDRKEYLFDRYQNEYVKNVLAFRNLCSECAGNSVQICIENTDGFELFQLQSIELLLQEPCFALTLDTGHDFCAHHADAAFFAAHANRLKHMHIHDAVDNNCHLALGDGELDIASLLQRAKEAGARVVLEIKTVEALKKSLSHPALR